MHPRTISSPRFLCVLSVFLMVGCSAPPKTRFMHRIHRVNYAVQDDDLKDVQFYISEEIFAQPMTAAAAEAVRGHRTIRLPAGTPGLVTEVGPDWIKVKFEEGGSGTPFLTDLGKPEDAYWFATEVEGQEGLHKVKDLEDRVYLYEGEPYRIIRGAGAFLTVTRSTIDGFMKQGYRVKGQVKESEESRRK